jgi:hypothetical protein
MKDLAATATGTTPTPIEECYALLSDFERYPDWFPDGIKAAEILEQGPDGEPVKIKTTLHVAHGPIVRDFKVHMAVTGRRPELIELRRLPKEPSGDHEEILVSWRLSDQDGGTEIEAGLRASLDIPRFLPIGGLADSMARGFLDAALAQLGR